MNLCLFNLYFGIQFECMGEHFWVQEDQLLSNIGDWLNEIYS